MRFRSELAWSLAFNEYRGTTESAKTRSKKKRKLDEHKLDSAPINTRRWLGTRWGIVAFKLLILSPVIYGNYDVISLNHILTIYKGYCIYKEKI